MREHLPFESSLELGALGSQRLAELKEDPNVLIHVTKGFSDLAHAHRVARETNEVFEGLRGYGAETPLIGAFVGDFGKEIAVYVATNKLKGQALDFGVNPRRLKELDRLLAGVLKAMGDAFAAGKPYFWDTKLDNIVQGKLPGAKGSPRLILTDLGPEGIEFGSPHDVSKFRTRVGLVILELLALVIPERKFPAMRAAIEELDSRFQLGIPPEMKQLL